MENFELSETAKMWAWAVGYTGVAIVVTAVCYHVFAKMIGVEVAKALVKAGVVAIA